MLVTMGGTRNQGAVKLTLFIKLFRQQHFGFQILRKENL